MSDQTENPIEDLTAAIADAKTKVELKGHDHICVIAMFPQMWGSTALGFGGLGGQSMTTAYTIVLSNNGWSRDYMVYFGRRFAYRVKRPNMRFMTDVGAQRLLPVAESGVYIDD